MQKKKYANAHISMGKVFVYIRFGSIFIIDNCHNDLENKYSNAYDKGNKNIIEIGKNYNNKYRGSSKKVRIEIRSTIIDCILNLLQINLIQLVQHCIYQLDSCMQSI